MFLRVILNILAFSSFQIFKLGSTITCSESEISIKSSLPASSVTLYQQAFVDYAFSRTAYGLNVKIFGEQYWNRTEWNNAVNSYDQSGYSFSVLDTELLVNEKSALPDFLSIPVAVGNFLFVYNLRDIDQLNLTVDAIVNIYLGIITNWNDSILQTLNPSASLPNKNIKVFAVASGSTENFYLSYFLGLQSRLWQQSYGQEPFFTIPWKSNVSYSFADDSADMLDSLHDKRNSIGYTTWSSLYSTIENNNVKVATIVNVRPDKFISTLPSWVKTLFDYNHVYIYSTFHTLQNLTENNELYLFSYFQNIVMNKLSLVTRSCCQIQESLGFIDFLLDYNENMDRGKYGYFSMPTAAVKHIRSSLLPLILCHGSQSYNEFKNQETLEQKAKRERLIMIIVPSALSIVLIAVTMVFGVYYKRVKLTRETFWIINSSEIHFDKVEKSEKCNNKSALSIHSRASEKGRAPSLNNAYCCGEKFEGRMGLWTKNKTRVMLTPIEKIKPLNSWKRRTKALVGNLCTSISHNNVSLLYGISSIDGKSYAVNQLCPKGTLNYVLSMCSYSLSHDIKYSLAYDVIQGMNYLHKKGIVHGQLTSFSCEVDGMWVVKLAHWSHCSVKLWEPDENCVDNMTEIDDNVTVVKRLYMDPEAVPGLYTFPVDVYSYGMLLVEIFTQKTPFFEEVELCVYQYSTLLQNKSNRIYDVPTMSTVVVPPDVQSLISMLIRADGVSRPSSTSILKRVQDLRGNSEKSVVDIVMQTLESYVLELEDKVVERTSAMKNLLNQLLPPQIASKFIQGQLVEPEFFECASILFSDIVGFTKISARSTPIQVMSFLNELWKEFDQTVERFDVYKIDTIGDAYMVASGLPDRNGINHCKCVADLSLALIRLAETFAIPHLGDEKLKIRIGINSGPVTAGIVGFKMPQYCVFGDAVNTASRMESTSMPFKVQVSEYFHSLMANYFPTYRFEYRGETEIKGKGNMKTYWLL